MMTYGRPSRSFRSSRGGRVSFRSRGTFRGRGRGSDSYYGSSRGSYSSSRGSYRGSSYRGRDDSYDSRDSSSRYSSDRYPSSHSRREDRGHHHRDLRESASGSYGREHSRRDGEPDRKRIRSEIGSSYKENSVASPMMLDSLSERAKRPRGNSGISPRRSYDDLDHSNRSYSASSPYRSDSSPFTKPHRSKEFSDFKKPLPPAESSFSGSSRGTRGRGIVRSISSRISRSSVPSFLKRSAIGRISRIKATSRLQQILRRKKQLRLMRIKKARETRSRISVKNEKPEENNINTSEEEEEDDDDIDDLDEDEEEDEAKAKTEELDDSIDKSDDNEKDSGAVSGDDGKTEAKKISAKRIKTESTSETSKSDSPKVKKEERPSMSTFHKDHITLKCVHCKIESPTFKRYAFHLSSYKHKTSMESVLYDLKQKLRHMRTEQREQQRIIDEQSNDFAKTSYCRLCKLNYKQTKQEHFTSDFHINLNEFLNPRCSVCRLSFATPILYEHHRCTLNHIKRKAFLEKKGVDVKDADNDDDNNDEDNFMVLDSVGSADEESADEAPAAGDAGNENEAATKSAPVKKKKLPKVVGAEFIKRVPVYYCKLCRLCMTYNPNRNQEDLLLSHCRGRFHLKKYSIEKARRTKEEAAKLKKRKLNKSSTSEDAGQNGNVDANDSAEVNDSFWDENAENQKSSEDEEEASNRYDRFGHSEENESTGNEKTKVENDANETVTAQA